VIVVVTRWPGIGGNDGLVSKFSGSGTHLWSRGIGRDRNDFFTSVVEDTVDGGLVMTGSTLGFYGNNYDVILLKLDPPDSLEWAVNIGYGDAGDDYGSFVSNDSPGGFLLAGMGFSSGGASRQAILATFDETGGTCTGDSIEFSIMPFIPEIITPDLVIDDVSPEIMTHSPTVDDFDPIKSWVCPPCGDANDDGYVTTADGYHILNYFGAGPQPASCFTANVNGDGNLTQSDGYHLLNYFGSGPQIYCGPCEF
jgi:hypothetical protein